MADVVVSAILGVLVEKLITKFEELSLLVFDDQFKEMEAEVRYVKAFLNDARLVDPNYQPNVLREITRDLQEPLYDANDIIADYELRLSKQQGKSMPICFSPSACYFRDNLGKRLKEVNRKIRDIKAEMKDYLGNALHLRGLSKQEIPNSSRSHPILIEEDKVVGLDDDAKKIIGWVLEADIPRQVIGIAGMGGVGKTTLAEKIRKNKNITENFKHALFVSISQQVDLKNVIKNLLRKLQVTEDSLKGDTHYLLEMLKDKLNGQKYLIVLDDVWRIEQESWWFSLASGLPETDGSCVIVTSRNDSVIKRMGAAAERIHHPKVLSDEDSWLLFSKIAFGGECPDSKLKDIAEEIVKKCGGLPLAIRTIGGTMREKGYDVDEWDRMLKRLNAKSTGNRRDDPVISSLELSYEELPSYLKSCLLCFAAFPEDDEIYMEPITLWWIGEEFIRERDGRSAMDIARDYMAQLLSRSLIMGAEKSDFERYYVSFKVHDLIREMLIQIAREENFIGLYEDTGRPIFSKHSHRAVNFYEKMDIKDFESNIKTNPKLRVLAYNSDSELSSTMKQKLCQLMWLRVLRFRLLDSDFDFKERKGLQFIMKKLKKQKKK